jgi:hypothetical protein
VNGACRFEPAVLRAVRLGHLEEDVREHTTECRQCGELLELAGLLEADRREAMAEASLPPAGALWFQMKLRAAREGRLHSLRTARLIQGASLLSAIAIAIATLGIPQLPELFAAAGAIRPSISPWAMPLLGASALFALLAPVAVWIGVARR